MAGVAPQRDLLAWLRERGILSCDGAMGTALQSRGGESWPCPEIRNLASPGDVESVHQAALEAGAELLETNSFGGSPARLAASGLEDRCDAINRAAAGLARSAAGDLALVLGSMGPTGELLEPLGSLAEARALDGFRRQAAALAEGGADALCVETMIDLREALLALEAALETGLPVAVSLVFEATPSGPRTLMGDAAGEAARALAGTGAHLVGSNCITGRELAVQVVRSLASEGGRPVLIQPNAGLPVPGPEGVAWPLGPEEMAALVAPLAAAGASIIGGCCGATPRHTARMAGEIRRVRASMAAGEPY